MDNNHDTLIVYRLMIFSFCNYGIYYELLIVITMNDLDFRISLNAEIHIILFIACNMLTDGWITNMHTIVFARMHMCNQVRWSRHLAI